MRNMILDIGAGSYCRGDVCLDVNPHWSSKYHDPTKFDFIAPKSRLYDYVIANADYPLPFRDNAFDGVLMIHVIEHLRCPYQTLLEVRRVLKPGGFLTIVTPNSYRNKADAYDEGHIYSFTPYSLPRLVRLVFSDVKVGTIFNELDIIINATKKNF